MASVESYDTETHNYRSAGPRTGLAASRRSSLVVQKIYRRGTSLAFHTLKPQLMQGYFLIVAG